MGILDFLFKKQYGNIKPEDPNSYRTAYAEYVQAQMGGDGALDAFYQRWNVKGEDHWSEIEALMLQNGQHMSAAQYAMQGQVAQAYANAGMAAPVEVDGIGIPLYVLMVLRLERVQSPAERATVLQAFGCDEMRFARIKSGFDQRMSAGTPDAAQVAAEYENQLAIARLGEAN